LLFKKQFLDEIGMQSLEKHQGTDVGAAHRNRLRHAAVSSQIARPAKDMSQLFAAFAIASAMGEVNANETLPSRKLSVASKTGMATKITILRKLVAWTQVRLFAATSNKAPAATTAARVIPRTSAPVVFAGQIDEPRKLPRPSKRANAAGSRQLSFSLGMTRRMAPEAHALSTPRKSKESDRFNIDENTPETSATGSKNWSTI